MVQVAESFPASLPGYLHVGEHRPVPEVLHGGRAERGVGGGLGEARPPPQHGVLQPADQAQHGAAHDCDGVEDGK